MACSTVALLQLLSWKFPLSHRKPTHTISSALLLQSQSPKYPRIQASKQSAQASIAPLLSPSSAPTEEEEEEEEEDEDVADEPKSTLRGLCEGHVPDNVLRRVEKVGYVLPTQIQRQALPVLFSGRDCILHAQTGSGKTLAYLLLIFSVVNPKRKAVQALIVVPTRELGMQVTKVARVLGDKCNIMALLDGGSLRRHKSWLKAEPPTIIVATVRSLCQMLEKQTIKLDTMRVLVIDEVDFMFNYSKEVGSLRKLLTSYSSIDRRQTIFASASVPQHRRFLHDCIQHKWTKADVVHVHVNSLQPMPSCLHHRFLICSRKERHSALLSLLESDEPQSAIIFVNEQSEKSKKAGDEPPTTVLIDELKASNVGNYEILLLEEKLNYRSRASSFSELRQGGVYLLVATDIAARGVDLPNTTHIYNFDLPKDPVHYLHRAGRTGRNPFSESKCIVTSIITPEEQFVLQRYQNVLMFDCEEISI